MRANRQENNRFVVQTVTKAILAFRYLLALFTDHKNDTEVSINAGTSATAEVEFSAGIGKVFCILIGIGKDSFNTALYVVPSGTVPPWQVGGRCWST